MSYFVKNKYLTILLFSFFIVSCDKFGEKPKANDGVINLSEYDFSENEIVKLDGDWEFYYNQLLAPKDFEKNHEYTFQEFPKDWNKYTINEEKITGRGYGTYRLKIIPNNKDSLYILRIGRIDVSYNLFANDKLIASAGVVADNKEENKPEWVVQTVEIGTRDTIELVLQIANFRHKKGGAKASLEITTLSKMIKSQERSFAFDFFLIGLILIMALYHFALFYLRHVDKSTLYFSLMLIWVILHLLMDEHLVIKFFFPNFNWELSLKINFLANFARIYFLTLFLYSTFKNQFSNLFVKVLSIIVITASVLIIITPASIYTHILPVFIITVIITLPYIIFVIIKSVFLKKEGSILALIGMTALLGTAINDILYNELIINTGYWVPYGLAIFILLHSIMISVRFTKAMNSVEKMSAELLDLNKNLEDKVKSRTQEIEQQKEELATQAESLLQANISVNTQKEKLEESHKQITDSINYASKIQQALLPANELFEQNFKEYFIFYRPKAVVSGDFYYLKKINEYIIIGVADCTGHGVPGAFVSMLGIAFLNEIIGKKNIKSAAAILEDLRNYVTNSLKHDTQSAISDGMDIALSVINTKTNDLEYAGANNPMYIIRNNKILKFKPTRNPIGSYVKIEAFKNNKIQILPNDNIYMFTDGFIDQFGGNKDEYEKFYISQFDKLLLSINEMSFEKQRKILEKRIKEWQGENKQIDDMLIIGVKV